MSKNYEELDAKEKDILAEYMNKVDEINKALNELDEIDPSNLKNKRQSILSKYNGYVKKMESGYPFLVTMTQEYKDRVADAHKGLIENGEKIDLSDFYAEMMMKNDRVKELDKLIRKNQDKLKQFAQGLKARIDSGEATSKQIDSFDNSIEAIIEQLKQFVENKVSTHMSFTEDDKRQLKQYVEQMFEGDKPKFSQEIFAEISTEKDIKAVRLDVQIAVDQKKELDVLEAETDKLVEENPVRLSDSEMAELDAAYEKVVNVLFSGNDRALSRLIDKMNDTAIDKSAEFEFNVDAFMATAPETVTEKMAAIQNKLVDRSNKKMSKFGSAKIWVRDQVNKFANRLAAVHHNDVTNETVNELYESIQTISKMGQKLGSVADQSLDSRQVNDPKYPLKKAAVQNFAKRRGKLTAIKQAQNIGKDIGDKVDRSSSGRRAAPPPATGKGSKGTMGTHRRK